MTAKLWRCPQCRYEYSFGRESTLYVYTREPLYNHLVTTCPACSSSQTIWDLSSIILELIGSEVEQVTAQTASRLHRKRYVVHHLPLTIYEQARIKQHLGELGWSILGKES